MSGRRAALQGSPQPAAAADAVTTHQEQENDDGAAPCELARGGAGPDAAAHAGETLGSPDDDVEELRAEAEAEADAVFSRPSTITELLDAKFMHIEVPYSLRYDSLAALAARVSGAISRSNPIPRRFLLGFVVRSGKDEFSGCFLVLKDSLLMHKACCLDFGLDTNKNLPSWSLSSGSPNDGAAAAAADANPLISPFGMAGTPSPFSFSDSLLHSLGLSEPDAPSMGMGFSMLNAREAPVFPVQGGTTNNREDDADEVARVFGSLGLADDAFRFADLTSGSSQQMNRNSAEKKLQNDAEAPRRARPQADAPVRCPRCNSTNTKFCYYNNFSLSQPRYFCKACRRYWTMGGSLRGVPVGGGSRKNKRSPSSAASSSASVAPGCEGSVGMPPTVNKIPGPTGGAMALSAMELLTWSAARYVPPGMGMPAAVFPSVMPVRHGMLGLLPGTRAAGEDGDVGRREGPEPSCPRTRSNDVAIPEEEQEQGRELTDPVLVDPSPTASQVCELHG
ncbi:hypothetical protein ACP4OV_028765 [Aristida adscensionis]